MINTALIYAALPALFHGLLVTLQITVCSLLLGFVCGTGLALVQTTGSRFFKRLVWLYVTVIRGTPMIVQIFFLNFVLLPALGIPLSALYGAILAIGLNSSAYVSQIVRLGIQSVDYGQIEAARVLGIPQRAIMRFIVLPQAIRTIVPALGNELVTLIKDSSLASLIGVMELYNEGRLVMSQTYDAISVYFIIAILYLVLTSTATYGMNIFEKWLNRHAGHKKTF